MWNVTVTDKTVRQSYFCIIFPSNNKTEHRTKLMKQIFLFYLRLDLPNGPSTSGMANRPSDFDLTTEKVPALS